MNSFHEVLNLTDVPLSEMSPVDVSLFQKLYPDWRYEKDSTGLLSSLRSRKNQIDWSSMAYLFNSGGPAISYHFPRAIIREYRGLPAV